MSKQQTTSVEDPGVRAALASSGMTLWDKRQTARVEDPETSSGIFPLFYNNVRGRSPITTLGDDSLCFYERQAARGFTLIELLVVVLIIGILAAVALPQYQKAVEKSRLTEVLSNIKTIETNYNLFLLAGGATSENVCLKDMGSAMELTGGTWAENGCTYTTPYFQYFGLTCDSSVCHGEISRIPNYDYTLMLDNRNDGYIEHVNTCYTQDTDLGRFICKSIESSGWKYIDEEY